MKKAFWIVFKLFHFFLVIVFVPEHILFIKQMKQEEFEKEIKLKLFLSQFDKNEQILMTCYNLSCLVLLNSFIGWELFLFLLVTNLNLFCLAELTSLHLQKKIFNFLFTFTTICREFRFRFRLGWFSIINNLIIIYNNN